jgi:hypothetical protein
MEKIICEGHDVLITGGEDYPIIGDLLSKEECEWAITQFAIKGYKRHWNCLEKAIFIASYLGKKGSVFRGVNGDVRGLYINIWIQI